jgi:hypothetical protein
VRGLLPTMYDGRSVHSRAVLADIGERFDVPVLTPIPRSVRFAEAPGVGGSILRTAPRSPGAKAYLEVAEALVRTWKARAPRRRATKSPAKQATPRKAVAKTSAAAAEPQRTAKTRATAKPKKPATKKSAAKKPAG